jgi:hypothetical protein
MSGQRDTTRNIDIVLEPNMLEYLGDVSQCPTQTSTIILGKVTTAAAMLYRNDKNDIHMEIFLPKDTDLTPPAKGERRVIDEVPAEMIIRDPKRPSLFKKWIHSEAEFIRVIATGDDD